MNLENELSAALRREPAPEDFAAKVLAKAGSSRTHRERPHPETTHRKTPLVMPFLRRPMRFAIAAALTLAAIVPPAAYQYRRRQRAVEARDQLMVALSITRVQLEHVREKIRQNARRKL